MITLSFDAKKQKQKTLNYVSIFYDDDDNNLYLDSVDK